MSKDSGSDASPRIGALEFSQLTVDIVEVLNHIHEGAHLLKINPQPTDCLINKGTLNSIMSDYAQLIALATEQQLALNRLRDSEFYPAESLVSEYNSNIHELLKVFSRLMVALQTHFTDEPQLKFNDKGLGVLEQVKSNIIDMNKRISKTALGGLLIAHTKYVDAQKKKQQQEQQNNKEQE